MSESTNTQMLLTNTSNHPLVAKVLAVIGTEVEVITCDYDNDESDTTYKFPNEKGALGIVGDDAIGAVIGAYMHDDNLILIANFGDEGDYHYNVVDSKFLQILKLEEL